MNIPIQVAVTGGAALAEQARIRLERSGFLRMMALAEPQLTEFVTRYKALGYEVELVPYTDDVGTGEADGEAGAPAEDCATIYVRKVKPPPGPR